MSSLVAVGTLERWKKVPKKVIFSLMARPLLPNPPSSLMAVGKMERWKKRLEKMARPFTPPAS